MTVEPVAVPIRGEMVRLGQFLKLADAVDQGSDVKALLSLGIVTVNGEVESRRGRQLGLGDVVVVAPIAYVVAADDDASSTP